MHTHTDTHFVSLWTVTHQDLLFMEFSRQEYWSGLSFSLSWDLSDPGNEPESPPSSAFAGGFFGVPCGSAGKESASNAGDLGSISGLGRSLGKGYSLQYSGLENSMDCIIHGVAKTQK